MSRARWAAAAACLALATGAAAAPAPAPVKVDGFERAADWQARPADGVSLALSDVPGRSGRALRLDFDFHGGGGYAVVHRDLSLDLPRDYAFSFWIRGECPIEQLEFKLVDGSGDNVWWHVERAFEFPRGWRRVVIKRRQLAFAWGPLGGGTVRHVAAIEFAVTAGTGGRGSVWLDDLELRERPPETSPPPAPRASASSAAPGFGPWGAVDSSSATAWRPAGRDARPWLEVDLGRPREFSALGLEWAPGGHPARYSVEGSLDGRAWDTLRTFAGAARGRDLLWLPESEERFLRVRPGAVAGGLPTLRGLALEPVDWAATRNDFFHRLAVGTARGSYPRGMLHEQLAWAVLGVDGGAREALLSEDGALESGKAGFSVEPFVLLGDSLVTWADVRSSPSLAAPGSPTPRVTWHHPAFDLEISAFPDGAPGAAWAMVRYRLLPRPGARASLVVAVRPFQVNPPMQLLNTPGGVAPIRSVARTAHGVAVDGLERVRWRTPPARFGALSLDDGGLVAALRAGRFPADSAVRDPQEAASAVMEYAAAAPGDTADVALAVEFLPATRAAVSGADPAAWSPDRARQVAAEWERRTGTLTLDLPRDGAEIARTVRANLAWILVNRDGPAIQPGSRAYERSWIRDGALTSTAMLRAHLDRPVAAFLRWFARHQYPDGKVPCCVDARGADPVPENDSHGEFIYLVAEYARLSGDWSVPRELWPHVEAAAAYVDSLRSTQRTEAYRSGERLAFFGLLPASISHEGYSAKPMHSYWDDLWALRGFKDAAWLAARLGRPDAARRWAAARDTFRADLGASIRRAAASHGIDYVPGCAELGDFDATSTTIALSPVDEAAHLPRAALERTFERYWEFFVKRRDGGSPWDAFTPYEVRNVGAFIRLGWRERAFELTRWFLRWRRPPEWRQWPEVVTRDPRAPRFIGDLPHTWVGSDFVRSVLDGFAYEREADSSLVVAAGIPERWARDPAGVRVRGLATAFGDLGLAVRPERGGVAVSVAAGLRVPPGGVVVVAPLTAAPREVRVDGRRVPAAARVVVRSLPATVWFR